MSGGSEIALWALLLAASMTDLLWGKVFNGITFSFLAVGLIYQFWRAGLPAGGSALLAVAVAFVIFFPLWRPLRVFAAGDVKLLMAAGAWSDFRFVLQLAMISIVVGALVGGFLLVKRQGLHGTLNSLIDGTETMLAPVKRGPSLKSQATRMPFAPAFLCAFFLVKIAEMQGWSVLWF